MTEQPPSTQHDLLSSNNPAFTPAQYETILHAAGGALLAIDEDGYIESAGHSVGALLGTEPATLIGMTLGDVLQPAPSLSPDVTEPQQVLCDLPSGERLWLRVTLQPAEHGWLCFLQDVSDQHAPLTGDDSLYRTLARHLPKSAVFLFDDDMTLQIAEGEALDPTKYPRKELEGRDMREVLSHYSNDPQQLIHAYEQVLEGTSTAFELEADGHHYYIDVIPVRDDDDAIIGGMVLAQNIDQQKQSQAALQASEQRLRVLLDTIPDMMFVVDADGYYLDSHISEDDRLLYGFPPDMIGMHVREIDFPDEVITETEHYLAQARMTGEPHSIEYTIPINDDMRDFEVRMIAFNGNDEVLMLVRDITDMKRVQRELGRHIDDLMIMQQVEDELSENLSLYNVTQLALDAFLRLSSAQSGYIALKDSNDTLFPMGVVGHYDEDNLRDHLENPTGILGRVTQHLRDELVIEVDSDPDYVPLLDDTQTLLLLPLVSNEQLIGVVCLESNSIQRLNLDRFPFLKLTANRVASLVENAQLHQQTESQLHDLQRLYEEVIKLEELKTDMIRIASHDLKNPLASIMGYLEMLGWNADQTLDSERQDYLKQIQKSARRMQEITTGILSLERIEQMANQQNSAKSFDLVRLVRKTIYEQRDAAREKGQMLYDELPDLPVYISGDPLQLHEAVSNLIGNALKYTPNGGKIIVRLQEMHDSAQFRVEDNGYGIPEGQQKRLFSPFFRAKSDETSGIEGTGLGLHLVKNIIKRHQGTMYFESVYGEGSTFGFDLPTSDPRPDDGDTGDISGATVIR